MKKIYLFAISLFAGVLVLTSCKDDNEKNPGGQTGTNLYDIDYSSANAQNWGEYMLRVSALLKNDAQTLYDDWVISYNGGAPFSAIFKTHNTSAYPSAFSCIEQILDGCADIANEVGDAKIKDPYDYYVSGDVTKALYAVESWYSWHSREDYSNNIISIRNAYYGTRDGSVSPNSISALILANDPARDADIVAAITGAYNKILAIPQPFRNHIVCAESEEAMEACLALEVKLDNLKSYIRTNLSQDPKLDAIITTYVDDVVIPTYADLKDRTAALYNACAAFKSAPGNQAFEECADKWMLARTPWETSEAFLFGPVDSEGLDPNMDSWPLDQVAIVNILTSGDFSDMDWSAGDSEAEITAAQNVRGFHTLEFLIFKNGNPRSINN